MEAVPDAAPPAGTAFFIVGLGNPGAEYAATRHNIGFIVLDTLADRLSVREFHFTGSSYWATCERRGATLHLCKPWTYMNRSGEAVAPIVEHAGIDPAHLLVVCDDVALPPGMLRLRTRGSSGGQNGLQSVIDEIGTSAFPRLRCGVGAPEAAGGLIDHVLAPFADNEQEIVARMVDRACDAILMFIDEGPARTMNMYNTAPEADAPF